MLIRRILMNAQDGSPGSGTSTPATPTAPAAPETPAAPAPQSAPASGSAIDVAAITRQISDGVFASLRRAGVLPGKSTTTVPVTGDTTAALSQTAAPAVDVMRLRALDRALNRAGFSASLDNRAYQRVERAFAEESPDDADGWVSDYFEGMGIKKTAAAPATAAPQTITAPPTAAPAATQPPAPAASTPISDRGSPPPSSLPLEERSLYEMSQADVQEYIKRHGMKKYSEKLIADAKGKRTLLA